MVNIVFYPVVSYKRKLGLISLAVLASLLCSNTGFAMEPEKKVENSKLLEQKLLTLDDVKTLILKAKNGDVQAQDEVMKTHYQRWHDNLLSPEKIEFLSWKTQDIDNSVKNNDFYAYFVITHFEKIGASFPNIFETNKERADQGNAMAQLNLGRMYALGRGVKKDENQAFIYTKLAADQGNAIAQYQLGHMYCAGSGVKQNEKEACRYYKFAADQGHALAQCNLGARYARGIGVEKDAIEAYRYYQLAAHQGDAGAQFCLGFRYKLGIGVEKDANQAFTYFQLAADQGCAEAQAALGNMYKEGSGVEKDEKEALRYYKPAADQGHVDAQLYLGYMYVAGIGVEKDEKEASRYYKLAADQGNALGQYSLGDMYKKGNGVEKNGIEALHLYIKAKHQEAEALPSYLNTKHQLVEAFIREALPNTQNAPLADPCFQEMLVEIMRGNNLNLGEEGGLARLISSHQTTIGKNTKRGFCENLIAIPRLAKMYTPIEELEVDAMNMMEWLETAKPGFMVTAVSLSPSMKEELPNQITPFFSCDELDKVSYLTIGEENVRLANRFISFLQGSDKKFMEADKALKKIGKLYQQGLDSVMSDLMVKQQLADISTPDNDDMKAFAQQSKKLQELEISLAPTFKKIEEEHALLCEIQTKIKSLPVRGAGSRNKDFLDEYPYLR